MLKKPSAGAAVASRLAALLRNNHADPPQYRDRPAGLVIWLHLPADFPIGPVREFCKMLKDRSKTAHCLVTAKEVSPLSALDTAFTAQTPDDQNAEIERFITHWHPDVLLWVDSTLQLKLLQRFKANKKPMFLVNAPVMDPSRRSQRRMISQALALFDGAQATSDEAVGQLMTFGFRAEKIQQVQEISPLAQPLPDNERRRRAITTQLGPRPIWCAANLRIAELSAVSTAHHMARKSFPTAAMILVPDKAEDVQEIVRILIADGWRVATEKDAPIDRQCDILVTNGADDLGVWLRLSSVAIMGGSLNGPASCDPFDASALGSAVVCGPITFPHGEKYRQLENAGGLVRVGKITDLGAELTAALAPDSSAELATSAWRAGSDSIEPLIKIIDLIAPFLEMDTA